MKKHILNIFFGLVFLIPLSSNSQTSKPNNSVSNIFTLAIQNATQLALSTNELTELNQATLLLNDSLKLSLAYLDSIKFNRLAYENRELSSILTNTQLLSLLKIKEEGWASNKANQKWLNAVAKSENDLYNKDSVINEVTNYYLNYKIVTDLHYNNPALVDSLNNQLLKTLSLSAKSLIYGNPLRESSINLYLKYALESRKLLGLTNVQTAPIFSYSKKRYQQLDSLQNNNSEYANGKLENATVINFLNQILTPDQLHQLALEVDRYYANGRARYTWQMAVSSKNTQSFIKDSAIRQLTNYYFKLNCLERQYGTDTSTLAMRAIDSLNGQTPDSLMVLVTYNKWYGADMNGQTMFVLHRSALLGLSQKQQDRLLRFARKVAKEKVGTDSSTISKINWAEKNNIKKALSDSQFAVLIPYRYERYSAPTSVEYWTRDVSRKITKNIDEGFGKQLIRTYLENKAMLSDWIYEDTSKLRQAYDSLNATIPDSLIALITGIKYPNADLGGLIGFALQNADTLQLADSIQKQFYTLAKGELQSEQFAKAHPDTSLFDRDFYEADLLPKLLSDSQYSKVLTLRFRPEAQKNAIANWQQLTTLGLSGNFNKDKTVQEITNYYVAQRNTQKRFANDPEQGKVLLRNLLLKMPQTLAILINAQKGGHGKPTNGTYQW